MPVHNCYIQGFESCQNFWDRNRPKHSDMEINTIVFPIKSISNYAGTVITWLCCNTIHITTSKQICISTGDFTKHFNFRTHKMD